MHTLTITAPTWVKTSTKAASVLPDSDKAFIKAGTYPIQSYSELDDYLLVTFDPTKFNIKDIHPTGRNTWHVYKPHVEDAAGYSPNNKPKDEPPDVKNPGVAFKLPGQSSTFYSNQPIIQNGNFTWGEALHFSGKAYRPPANARVVDGIISSAKAMQDIREFLDRPIYINSWYRDPATNRRVNGATQSTHMTGLGVDFRVEGMLPADVYAKLDPWWGNRGGLASSSVFTHADVRGYYARWRYGF
ncbi:MAG: hypothetical protein KME47_09485 [Nodosilinea sp. WJT8-NPBG4]|jgi:hypothetical protein|nr:hypothetical protein [Nodosilinea sp. WJT8-NPBG4]